MAPTARMRRVNEAVREVLSLHVERLKDPRIGFVTLTGVETSPDLRHAQVFVTVLGNERKRQAALDGLHSARAVLQAEIASQLRMKRTPTLEFVYDRSLDRGMRIGQLLHRELGDRDLEAEAAQAAEAEAGTTADVEPPR